MDLKKYQGFSWKVIVRQPIEKAFKQQMFLLFMSITVLLNKWIINIISTPLKIKCDSW